MEEETHGGQVPKAHESHQWGPDRERGPGNKASPFLVWATQLVKVDCKNGPNSWQGFSLQRQSVFPVHESRLGLTLAWDYSCALVPWAEFWARLPDGLQLAFFCFWSLRTPVWTILGLTGGWQGTQTWFLCHPGHGQPRPGIRAAQLWTLSMPAKIERRMDQLSLAQVADSQSC